MSNEVTTPAQFALSFGTLTTNREVDTVTAMRVAVNGGFVLNALGTGSALTALDLSNLGRINRTMPFTENGNASQQFQLLYQRALEAIENSINKINEAVNANTANIAALQAISAQAQAANDNATTVNERTSIEGSYTDPTKVLTASADGTITIAAHTRRYTDGSSVSVDAGSVSGLTNETKYRVWYPDASREGGAVSYQATTSVVAQAGNVHLAGEATIPAFGDPPNTGTGPTGPGVTPPSEGDPAEGYETSI